MNTPVDDMYMKKHLVQYILFQVEQGYALEDVKKALERFGYKKWLVQEVVRGTGISPAPRKKPALYAAEGLDQELRIYVQSLLIDYIVKEHKVGYTLDAIRKALIHFGHDPTLIDEAMTIIKQGKVVDYRADSAPFKFPHRIIASLTLFLLFCFLVFLSIATDTSLFTIFPQFLPLFVAFVLINILFLLVGNTRLVAALPLFGILIAVATFIGGVSYDFLGRAPGSNVILILNAVLTFISTGIVCAFSKKEKDTVVVTIKDAKKRKQHEQEEKIIEEKIHVPKIGASLPKEPYHPSSVHWKQKQPLHEKHNVHRPTRSPTPAYHGPASQLYPQKSQSMLHYLREEIDKPIKRKEHVAAVSHLPEKQEKKERLRIKEM